MLFTKMMVNHLRGVLPRLISLYVNAFVLKCLIFDNILMGHEVLEYIRKTNKGSKVYTVLKLDISKAYDRIS